MSVIEGFNGASILSKLAVIFLMFGTVCVYIAFTCTGWIENDLGVHWGLWRICTDSDVVRGCTVLDGTSNDWWVATQALSVAGFVGINVSFFLVILYLFVGKCQKNGEVGMAAAIVCIATGVLFLIGIIIFGVMFDEHYKNQSKIINHTLSYSFVFAIIAVILEICSGVFMILETKKGGGTSPTA